MIATALTVAGSDSSAGAGIQADLKTFSAFGVYGLTALTAITAQNSKQISHVVFLEPEIITAQIQAVIDDYPVGAVKLGMLGTASVMTCVFDALKSLTNVPVVMDPVMLSKTGRVLLELDAVEMLLHTYSHQVTLLTPNIPETEFLTQSEIKSFEDMKTAAVKLYERGFQQVLIKGGHLEKNTCLDLLFDGRAFWEWQSPRQNTPNTHGTGCTYASAIASGLALGHCTIEAVDRAKRFIDASIANHVNLGEGAGPLGHFTYREQL